MLISLIFAMDANRIIGDNGKLPWRLPSDLKRFKELTTGHPVIMGRKTFESILALNGKPLANRCNVVITSHIMIWKNRQLQDPELYRNCVFAPSLYEGIRLMESELEAFIIGGAEIYSQALDLANRMYFTQVGGSFEGDAKFPLFNQHEWFTTHDELVTTDTHPYAFSIMQHVIRPKRSTGIIGTNLVNPTFAKGAGYGDTIADIIANGVCPFCPETFLWHPWPILQRSGDWFITRSGWPYLNAEHHFVIIGPRHITTDIEMSNTDDHHVKHLTRWAVRQFNLKGWGRVARSGDTDRTGATVQHLHFHLIQPKIGEDGKALTVYFPIG